jgi:hypothetical protein
MERAAMITKEKVHWRQLNGPQIEAYMDALWAFQIEKYDTLLDYFAGLSIQTANSAHLDFIGKIMRIPRAVILIEESFDQLLLFSEGVQSGVLPAFSGDATQRAGVFGRRPRDFDPQHFQTVDDDTYRKILLTVAQNTGHSKGIALLDALCYDFLAIRTPDGRSKNIYYEIQEDPQSVGDLRVAIASLAGYNQVILQQILNQLFTSVPHVTLFFDETLARNIKD